MIKKLAAGIILLALFCQAYPLYAQNGTSETLTKGDALMLLSATDFMKQKISDLLSWTIGYDISKLSRVRLTPSINYVRAVPRRVPPDGRTVFDIVAGVDDPGGLGNIAGVRADLSNIGRLSNMMLVDNGLYGDEKAADGIYTLQTSVPYSVDVGQKEIAVAVANKKGWLALAKTTLDIKKNPTIIDAAFSPERVRANGKDLTALIVKVDNPGRIEDIRSVTADLRAFGFSELALLRNDGKMGDMMAGDNLFTLQFSVPSAIKSGDYMIRIGVANLAGGYAAEDRILKVYK